MKLEEAIVVIKEILSLIEDDILVRNTKDDGDMGAFIKQGIRITNTLYKANEIIKQMEGK